VVTFIAKIQAGNRIVIPKAIRELLKLKPGSYVTVHLDIPRTVKVFGPDKIIYELERK